MRKLKHYGLIALLVIASLIIIWQYFEIKELSYKPEQQVARIENVEVKFDRYGASVLQIGGVGSRITEKTAYALDDQNYFTDPNEWVMVGFNGPADMMRIGCRDGFDIESCVSNSGNKVFTEGSSTCGTVVQDKMQNSLRIECNKK